MTDQWERFADSVDRSLGALGWDANVDVYQPTETQAAGRGYDVTYPGTPTTTVTGALDTPDEQPDIDAGGTTERVDLVVYVAVDTGVAWTGAGEPAQAKTGVEIDGQQYVVSAVENQRDGFVALECNEVDQWP